VTSRCLVLRQYNVENCTGKCTWEQPWLYVYLNFVWGYFMMLHYSGCVLICTECDLWVCRSDRQVAESSESPWQAMLFCSAGKLRLGRYLGMSVALRGDSPGEGTWLGDYYLCQNIFPIYYSACAGCKRSSGRSTVIPRLTSDPVNEFFRLTKIFSPLFLDSANECFSGFALT